MSDSIISVTTDKQLYAIYTNHKRDYDGIKARQRQRLKWLNNFLKNGSCKQKLIKCGVIEK